MHSEYASSGMASSGTTTMGSVLMLVDANNDVVLTVDDGPARVGVIHQCRITSDILASLVSSTTGSTTSDRDAIVSTVAGVGLEIPNTGTDGGGGAGGVEV